MIHKIFSRLSKHTLCRELSHRFAEQIRTHESPPKYNNLLNVNWTRFSAFVTIARLTIVRADSAESYSQVSKLRDLSTVIRATQQLTMHHQSYK